MDFIEPLKYPLKDLKKLVIGGLLLFPGLFLLFIPLLISLGYTVKVAGDTTRGKDELPEFDDWGYLLKKGFGYVGIDILYTILMYLLFVPAVILFSVAEGNIALMLAGLIFGIAGLIAAIVIAFMEYVALVRYGEKENIGAAFAFGEIFRKLKANVGNYIIGFIVLIALGAAYYVLLIIAIITIVGVLFLGIITFYYLLVSMRMFAQLYKEPLVKA